MTRRSGAALAAALTVTGMWLAACGADRPVDRKSPAPAETADAITPSVSPAKPELSAAQPATAGAPVFAVLYPGAEPDGPVTLAQGPSGPGGILAFTTTATPEQVVEFYRTRAEAAGLRSINAMNQGGALGYSAGDGATGRGQLLSVVATPTENGLTSVQLDWSAGR